MFSLLPVRVNVPALLLKRGHHAVKGLGKSLWPLVLLTDDDETDARILLNEFGDHWGQETAHRIGKHDLYLDILPPGYVLTSRRDDQVVLVWAGQDWRLPGGTG